MPPYYTCFYGDITLLRSVITLICASEYKTSLSIEVMAMAKCPRCGMEVDKPIKTWVLKPKSRETKGVIIGLFRCPNGHYFRVKLGEVE